MKKAFFILILIHGLIHSGGFVKSFNFEDGNIVIQNVTKVYGMFWLAASILFIITALLFLAGRKVWMVFSLLAIALSQYLLIVYWPDAKFGTVFNAIILLGTTGSFLSWNFSNKYRRALKRYLKNEGGNDVSILSEADIQFLPGPVIRYLHYAGVIGYPKVHNFKVKFSGRIRKNDLSSWMTFTSEQYNFINSGARLFFMKASFKGLPIAGFHCFQNGKAFMDIRLFSWFKIQYQSGNEMDISETVTFLNDMCCMAPAALIDKRLQWLEVNKNKVSVAFTHNNINVTAWLHFNDEGALINFVSEDRFATLQKRMIRLPWSTPLKNYKPYNGFRLAGYADTTYHYPSGDFNYGNFRVEEVVYNCKN